ncbi:prepilin-type N-terminal cleavage/methylation domain-containing protein [Sporosarcina sp. P19]|uniref:prepilin-type N-terminal cleavage/methylation domain-containing protein n=1 Tax=Sporosarcina sp. P19 TaxID=2048258 RepID=UPI0013042F62|nr:prepilin-type N-terminal cleavage/methylation domain-containing protein [Sporosarcina sp. P19]
MGNSVKDQKGITLVELLAVLVLLSLIGLMIFGVYLSGKKEYDIQKEKTEHQENILYVMKYLTKEIRKENNFRVFDEDVLEIKKEIGTDIYRRKGTTLFKNDEVLADNIKDFKVESSDGKALKIEVFSDDKLNRNKDAKKIETTIVIRKGGES